MEFRKNPKNATSGSKVNRKPSVNERKSTMGDHPRRITRNFLSPETCKELEFIHKSCSAVGYRRNVFSTTLHHLIATNCAHLIMPLVAIRERLKEIVEEHFGVEYELFVEFTGLISWCKGSSIGWHSDDNREYLRQRDFAAVCYLNTHGVDFNGGLFHFRDGEPSSFSPIAGDVLIYTADERNVHRVDEIVEGERTTLTLWFTRDSAFDEDANLLKSLPDPLMEWSSYSPVLASNSMYWFPPEEASRFESGFHVCYARLHLLGFHVCFSSATDPDPASSDNTLLSMNGPLYMVHGSEVLQWEFMNILHSLQVVQFYIWKEADLGMDDRQGPPWISKTMMEASESQLEMIKRLKNVFLKDAQMAEELLGMRPENLHRKFSGFRFSAAVSEWEAYTSNLQRQMAISLPQWRNYKSIFSLA